VALAEKVVAALEKHPNVTVTPAYALEDSLEEKVRKVAAQIYGADGVEFSEAAQAKLKQFTAWGYADLPVCIAKLLGAPTGWTLHITDAALSAGAGFVVMIAGNMMLMPGLPKVSRAAEIDVNAEGVITGI